jgi:hypothetical protein
VLPNTSLAVADMFAVHPTTTKYIHAAAQTHGAAAASQDTEKRAKYGAGEQVAVDRTLSLSTQIWGKMGSQAHKFSRPLLLRQCTRL